MMSCKHFTVKGDTSSTSLSIGLTGSVSESRNTPPNLQYKKVSFAYVSLTDSMSESEKYASISRCEACHLCICVCHAEMADKMRM